MASEKVYSQGVHDNTLKLKPAEDQRLPERTNARRLHDKRWIERARPSRLALTSATNSIPQKTDHGQSSPTETIEKSKEKVKSTEKSEVGPLRNCQPMHDTSFAKRRDHIHPLRNCHLVPSDSRI
jgi:hypothetical protein